MNQQHQVTSNTQKSTVHLSFTPTGSQGLTEPTTPTTASSSSVITTPNTATALFPGHGATPHPAVNKPLSLLGQVIGCFAPRHLEYQCRSHAQQEDLYISTELLPQYYCLFTSCQPPISFQDYLSSLICNSKASSVCYVMAAGYALRLEATKVLPLTPKSIHRIYLACLILAIKTHDDFFRKQSFYAYCGGVPVKELNMMERAVWAALGYNTTLGSKQLVQLVELSSKNQRATNV